jgi:ribosome maturation factor RimP
LNIEEILISYLTEALVFPLGLYAIKVHSRGKQNLIEVAVDNFENKYGSVSISDCEFVSRLVSQYLDTHSPDLLYTLRVSSAGAERQLVIPKDLFRFKEVPLKLEYKGVDEKIEVNVFKIVEINDTEVVLELYSKHKKKKKSNLTIKLDTIIRGNIFLDI